ncbi:ComF family protein [Bisbaumannia pacifica]|uniref:ComF family protein n=1 Tax=Bisbaumannia pacifica TaxID=77098 RepID=UPI001E33E8D7|nr:ComF family protein [Halomonas pacifica]
MSTSIIHWVDHALRRALPGRCAFCLGPAERQAPWCHDCLLALPWNLPACPRCGEPQAGQGLGRPCGACLRRTPAFDRTRAPLRYAGAVEGLVRAFKFHASPRAGSVLLELFLRDLTLPPVAALVAVPLHDRRARRRGFDQADWLARRLARRLELPWIEARRVRDTPSQRGLDRPARRANLRRAFRIDSALPARVALVDDVMTTGATLEALALACRRAGAETVEAWAMARTPLESAAGAPGISGD